MLETGFTPTVDFSKTHMMRDKRSSATSLMLRTLHQSYRPKAPFEPSVLGGVTSWSLSACWDVSVAMPRCSLLGRVQGLVRALRRGRQPPAAAFNRCDTHQGRSQPLLQTHSVSLQRLRHPTADPCFVSVRRLCQASLSERRRLAGSFFW